MIIEEPFRLVYTFGDADDPGNRYGAVVLQLFADGRVYLDNVFAGRFTKSWEGVAARTTLQRILGHLDEASFPAVEDHEIPPGGFLRVVLVQSGATELHNSPIDWHAAAEMRGYGPAFGLLDSLIAELSAGAIPTVHAVETGLVRPAEAPARPAVGLDEAYHLGLAPALVGVGLLARSDRVRESARREAGGLVETIGRLLGKYGRAAPAAPADAAAFDGWAQEVYWVVETLVSGPAAEAFALGRAVGAVRLSVEEGAPGRMDDALPILGFSRHAPAEEIARLAQEAPLDLPARIDDLGRSLRRALGA